MNIEQLRHIYFLGIGGIGMSALARYFKSLGVHVSGYDKTPTPLTSKLQEEGIQIHFEDQPDFIPSETELVIYTPAIPTDLNEYKYIVENEYPLMKRSQALGKITKGKFTIAVAGTHGKTTISSMIAHIFRVAGEKSTALIGGILNQYNTNFLGFDESDVFIVEADEFDRSFLTLDPDIALISSMDADHLDIYGSENHLLESFEMFVKKIRDGGHLILKSGLNLKTESVFKQQYSLNEKANFYCSDLKVNNGKYIVSITYFNEVLENVLISYPGKHNLENALGAFAVAKVYGISDDKIIQALKSYPGVKRRFEEIYKSEKITYIDDYAHHPEELKACINSVKELYPDKKISGIFQPHLYSRTRDFADEFARSLELLDEVIVMDIYPARELPIEGINAKFLLDKINHFRKFHMSDDEVLDYVKSFKSGVLLSLGAGDIDKLVQPIKEILKA